MQLLNWSATFVCTGSDIICDHASTAISGDAVEGGGGGKDININIMCS